MVRDQDLRCVLQWTKGKMILQGVQQILFVGLDTLQQASMYKIKNSCTIFGNVALQNTNSVSICALRCAIEQVHLFILQYMYVGGAIPTVRQLICTMNYPELLYVVLDKVGQKLIGRKIYTWFQQLLLWIQCLNSLHLTLMMLLRPYNFEGWSARFKTIVSISSCGQKGRRIITGRNVKWSVPIPANHISANTFLP